ncbi:conjugal transfer protein TraF [Streptococcus uberis]|uniref:conjugal transfer protein TraF n=1 Tax=Streptococcus uberis TaxID=1349 RepID=UPI001FF3BC4F|nr:conjugal transfer protein TraF [Streptococcus uberis]MCK1230266.1 conjugal transfer protein TraF [Streptococcus uberis]
MDFQEAVSGFEEISISTLEQKLNSEDTIIVFFGRSTCPYCRRFAPKLAQVAQEKALQVYFIDTDNLVDFEDIQDFRYQYGIKTVPRLLVGNTGSVGVVCDSSLSPTEIATFILGGAEK